MANPDLPLMSDPQSVPVSYETLYACLAVSVVIYIIRWRTNPLNAIPTVGGPSAPLLSYLTAFKYMRHGREVLMEGYERYRGATFKIAVSKRWIVVISDPKLLDDLSKRPDEEFSFMEASEDLFCLKSIVNRDIYEDRYHIDVIKNQLTRSLPVVLPQVIDELEVAVPECIQTTTDEWITTKVMPTMRNIITRASNRAFVGLPLCRNEAYLDLAMAFAIDVSQNRTYLNLFPEFARTFVASLTSTARHSVRCAVPYLKPLLDERRLMYENHGNDWEDRPNDMLQWLVEEVMHVPKRNLDADIAEKLFLINIAAIHTLTIVIAHALYDLAASPEYIEPLREEIDSIVAAEGWTKTAIGKMRQLDSLLKESSRLNFGVLSMSRKAMKNITLSDGTFVPKDTFVMTALYAINHNESIYPNAHVFDPFRFARMGEVDGESTKYQYVNTASHEHSNAFGYGRHACPGRYFAAYELKALLAYILVNYDMKLPGDGNRPENVWDGRTVHPNPNGAVMFRKRQTLA